MKKLGQHFLKNTEVIPVIIKSLDIQKEDSVIEIGPGKEALTTSLKKECEEKNCNLILVEKDLTLAKKLISKDYKVIPEDILTSIEKITQPLNNYRVVGNIPYYITGNLLRKISELKNKPKKIVLMVQEEVAERIVSSKMSLLSACVKFFSEPKIIFRLKPSDFIPPPKVKSAVIELTPINPNFDADSYYEFVKIVFRQPRKTLANNLSMGLKKSKEETIKILESLNINKKARPHDLTIDQIKSLL